MFQISRMLRSVNLDCEKPSIEFTHSKEKKTSLFLVLSLKWGLRSHFSKICQSDAQRL